MRLKPILAAAIALAAFAPASRSADAQGFVSGDNVESSESAGDIVESGQNALAPTETASGALPNRPLSSRGGFSDQSPPSPTSLRNAVRSCVPRFSATRRRKSLRLFASRAARFVTIGAMGPMYTASRAVI